MNPLLVKVKDPVSEGHHVIYSTFITPSLTFPPHTSLTPGRIVCELAQLHGIAVIR